MSFISKELVLDYSIEYIRKKYNPENSNGYFNFYIVRVGIDEMHQPDTIYVAELPLSTLLITNIQTAKDLFMEKCNFKKEYLVKVLFDNSKKKLYSEILIDIPDR